MDIEATKLELMHLLLQTQKETLLAKVKKVFEDDQDWWDEMSDEERKEVEMGIAQADKGQLVPHEKVMKRFDKWR